MCFGFGTTGAMHRSVSHIRIRTYNQRGWTGAPAAQLFFVPTKHTAHRRQAQAHAAVFFLAGFFPALLSAHDRAMLFSTTEYWLPGVISIFVALVVAAVVGNPRLSPGGPRRDRHRL